MHCQFLHPEVLFLSNPFLHTASSKTNYKKNYQKITKTKQKKPQQENYKKLQKITKIYQFLLNNTL